MYTFIYLFNGMDAKNGYEYIHYLHLKWKKAHHIEQRNRENDCLWIGAAMYQYNFSAFDNYRHTYFIHVKAK